MADDLIKCDDMNALLWYMINRANKRYVWKPTKYRHDDEFRADYPHVDEGQKLKKEDGIVTFEFHEKSTNLVDAYGNDYLQQTPYNNVLHVFIGDVREKSTPLMQQIVEQQKQQAENEKEQEILKDKIENKQTDIDLFKQNFIELDEALASGELNNEEYAKQL